MQLFIILFFILFACIVYITLGRRLHEGLKNNSTISHLKKERQSYLLKINELKVRMEQISNETTSIIPKIETIKKENKDIQNVINELEDNQNIEKYNWEESKKRNNRLYSYLNF